MTPNPADRLSHDRAVVTQPVWNRFTPAGDATGLPREVLLHAGPPFVSVEEVPAPVMNSACVAAVFEGLADDLDTAEAAIRAGEIRLAPAQDHAVVTPLAAVVSASMPLHTVYDAHRGQVRVFAPINGGTAPAPRLGLRSMEVVAHLRWLNAAVAETLEDGIGEGVPLLPLAVAGLAQGDDCHGRTPAATAALIAELEARTPGGIRDARVRAFLAASPSMFLNLWMAATKCLMRLAEGVEGSSWVTAAGGNGVATGIQIAGLPGQWFTARATPPAGRLKAGVELARALPAIGDSAVVEAFGLGAMAFHLSPAQMAELGPFLPADAAERRATLTLGGHPSFREFDLRLGISARAVAATGKGPVVGLGILDRTGAEGRLGGGIHEMPPAPFAAAVAALEA